MTLDNAAPYSLRHSHRARRLQAVVRNGRVEVVVPGWVRTRHLDAFLRRVEPWIARQAALLKDRAGTVLPSRCEGGASVLLEGETRTLRVEERPGRPRVSLNGELLVMVAPMAPDLRESKVRRVLIAWLKRRVRTLCEGYIDTYSPRLGVTPRGLRIKSQKTRWGSCGPTGLININWRLIGAPPRVLEYIVVHELCHLRERNHGAGFWSLLASQMPSYQLHRTWLKEHGLRLGRQPDVAIG